MLHGNINHVYMKGKSTPTGGLRHTHLGWWFETLSIKSKYLGFQLRSAEKACPICGDGTFRLACMPTAADLLIITENGKRGVFEKSNERLLHCCRLTEELHNLRTRGEV